MDTLANDDERAERLARRALEVGGLADPTAGDPGPVLRWMAAQGLEPLAARVWGGDSRLPAETRAALRQAFLREVVGHRKAAEAMIRLHDALESAGVPYVLLKGPHLREAFYAGLGGRPYGDLDVAVAPGDLPRAAQAIEGLGYRAKGGAVFDLVVRRFHFHETFAAPGGTEVELHWGLTDRFNLTRIDLRGVVARARRFEIRGVPLRVPEPGDLLLYLAVHAAKHGLLNGPALRAERPLDWFFSPVGGNRMIWMLDLVLLVDAAFAELEWDALAARVRAWNVVAEAASALTLAARALPGSRLEEARDRLGLGGCEGAGHPFDRLALALADRAPRRAAAMDPRSFFRPTRVLGLGHALAPSPGELLRFYRRRHRGWLPVLYPVHPAVLVVRPFTPW